MNKISRKGFSVCVVCISYLVWGDGEPLFIGGESLRGPFPRTTSAQLERLVVDLLGKMSD